MKRFLPFIVLFFTLSAAAQTPQTSYYKGEWTRTGSAFNYSAMIKLVVTGEHVEGEIIWRLVSGDSLDKGTYPYFNSRQGLTAIEKVSGELNLKTNDISFKGISVVDPNQIIGMDEYSLRWSSGKKAIYGRTSSGGSWRGSFYAVRIDSPSAATEFINLTKTVKKKAF